MNAAAGSDWSGPGTEASAFMIGVDAAGRHVVPAADALLAIATSEQHPITGAACGARVIVARKWGQYHRNHPVLKSDDRLCPTCVWSAALATGRLEQELDALRPRDITLQVMVQLLPDPQILPRLCRSIIDQLGVDEQDHPRLIEVLAHATAHRPVLLLPEECGDGECDHQRCTGTDGVLACPACSLLAGGWAGEWEGQYQPECTIAAPCQVLTTLAASYGINVTDPADSHA
ncbi:MAG: hypothetical protein DLM59_11525 [Pseudonocardiales bacterium]|nr:MAG: hypothetical protein DLM59_11525 [Pseudonocardiales bacterium]